MAAYKIPYGQSDYKKIKTKSFLYVDKTRYIEEIEKLNTDFPIFLRPRRFGKSLFISTLFYYYDIESADQFVELFGDTYIGVHKTELANQYYVLQFDFSGLSTVSKEELQKAFYQRVDESLIAFINHYHLDVDRKSQEFSNPASFVSYFLTNIRKFTDKNVYVMVDEYDHFANDIIGDQDFFNAITGKDGFVRNFYEVLKTHAGTGCIDKIFITGVTPMTLDSFTSGFNIAKNESLNTMFNEMMGFTEAETKSLLKMLEIPEEEGIMELLSAQYNGYQFHLDEGEKKLRVFNSNLVLFFLDEYQKRGKMPRTLIDKNIHSDYSKLADMMALYRDEESRTALLQDIMTGKSVMSNIVSNFTFTASSFSREEFLSMLFYLGLLTIQSANAFDVELKSPNAVIRDVYYNYYSEYLSLDQKEKNEAMKAVAYENDFTKFNALIEKILKSHNTDDFRGFDEARLKSVFLASLSTQEAYLVKSEFQSSGRKIDIALIDYRNGSTGVKYNYLIELKYLKKKKKVKKDDTKETIEVEVTAAEIQAARDEAYMQMETYLSLPEFRQIGRTKGVIYVVVKDEIKFFEEVSKA